MNSETKHLNDRIKYLESELIEKDDEINNMNILLGHMHNIASSFSKMCDILMDIRDELTDIDD